MKARGWCLLFVAASAACVARGADVHHEARAPLAASGPAVRVAPEPGALGADGGEPAAPPSTDAGKEPTPGWAAGSAADRLRALRVNDDDWARRELVTWTRPTQVDSMRASHVCRGPRRSAEV
jgi:hypothetical protein